MKKIISIFFVFSLLITLSWGIVSAQEYNQAPMLEDQVKKGKLPAVEKRLPETPMVVKPNDSTGNMEELWSGELSIIIMEIMNPPLCWIELQKILFPMWLKTGNLVMKAKI